MGKEDTLLSQLTSLMNEAQPLKLFNTYRGIPISYDARITDIDQGCVILNVHKYQAVCMFLDSKTYLVDLNLLNNYEAQVISLDVAKRQVVLAVFKKVGKSVDRRTAVRVQLSAAHRTRKTPCGSSVENKVDADHHQRQDHSIEPEKPGPEESVFQPGPQRIAFGGEPADRMQERLTVLEP